MADWTFLFFAALMLGWPIAICIGAWLIQRRYRDEEDSRG